MDIRVYYEDTDAAGVVYHSNYLKYLERDRTEFFRHHGFSVAELAAAGYVFPVVRMEIDFRSPAQHDDLLKVVSAPEHVSGSRIIMRQQVIRIEDGALLVEAMVTLACVSSVLKARRIPEQIRRGISGQIFRYNEAESGQSTAEPQAAAGDA